MNDPDPFGEQLSSAYCGSNYSAAVTKDGKVYTWGSGEFGRLGFTDVKI